MVLTEFLLIPTLTNFRTQSQAWKVHWTAWEEGIVDGDKNATLQWVHVVECIGKGISERSVAFVKEHCFEELLARCPEQSRTYQMC